MAGKHTRIKRSDCKLKKGQSPLSAWDSVDRDSPLFLHKSISVDKVNNFIYSKTLIKQEGLLCLS